MKNGTYKCPFCGNEQFGANTLSVPGQLTSVTALLGIPSSADPGANPTAMHSFYTFSCLKCGHTDFFHRMQVDQWFAEKKATKNG
jgi:predicted nucleic-acid-binding Zn-ribbon protein